MDVSHRIVSWTDAHALGLPEVDDQHRRLFERVNALWACVAAKAPAACVLAALRELEQDTLAHFAAEETFMRLMEYPLLPEHRQQHQALARRVAAERQRAETGQGVSPDLVPLFRDGLVQHIQVADRSYAAHLQLERQADAQPQAQMARVTARVTARLTARLMARSGLRFGC